jgi:two-component system OmpR family sensor kinase/two-component system sensor histidine kinase BaeS
MMNQRIRLADNQGQVVYDTATRGPGDPLGLTERKNALPLHSGLKTVGYLLAEGGMGFNQGDEQLLLGRLTRAAVIAGLVAGGISLLVAFLLAFSFLRPVEELTHAAEQLASGDLTQRVPVRGNDELATLGRAFNGMAESLQQAGESRRAMTADISHELRNPLAVQRANLEALQDGVYPLTPQNLRPALEQNLLLTRLVDDLHTLALADAGQLSVERIPTDFLALVRQVAERFEPQAAARQVQLKSGGLANRGAAIPPIQVDPIRVEQILNNLLSNALRYTPDGGSIELTARQSGDAVELAVHDSGPGMPAGALPHVFERFYRAERSRSRSEGGAGLGLAIARQIAEAHGGSLQAANHPQGGAVFTLRLPK